VIFHWEANCIAINIFARPGLMRIIWLIKNTRQRLMKDVDSRGLGTVRAGWQREDELVQFFKIRCHIPKQIVGPWHRSIQPCQCSINILPWRKCVYDEHSHPGTVRLLEGGEFRRKPDKGDRMVPGLYCAHIVRIYWNRGSNRTAM